ncbi:MAG TPA: helix-turn-helix domain-containing protein [Gemmatimonadaceae bacterium]|jgi:AcrR family transcriptional regulator
MSAAEHLIIRGGVGVCGVNAIAHEAGVDKVLIYRYFGGAAELISAVIGAHGAWPRPSETAPASGSSAGMSAGISAGTALATALVCQSRDIRARPLARRALSWEAAGQSSPNVADAIGRETTVAGAADALRSCHALPAHLDLEAVTALLAAGLTFLAIRADAQQPFFGIDTSNDAHWHRVERAATMMLRTLLDPSDA